MIRYLLVGFIALICLVPRPVTGQDILIWHSYRGAEQEALETLLLRWNKDHPDRRVRSLAVPHGAYANKLSAAIPRGHGPDVFIYAHERIGDWARSGLIQPIELNRNIKERFLPVSLDALHHKGALYGVPLSMKSLALFYNRALISSPPKTTDEMISAAQRLTRGNQFGIAYEAGDFYRHAAWFYGFGGVLFTAEDRVELDSPAMVESLHFVKDLYEAGLIPPDANTALISQLFNDGQAAMAINGPWFLGELGENLNFGVAPLPVVSKTGLPAKPFLTVEAALLSAHGKNPEGGRALALFLALDEGARVRLEKGRQLVADKSIYERNDLSIPDALKQFKAQAEHAVPMPNDPRMRSVWVPAGKALRAVLRGDLTPEDAARRAQREFEILTRPPPPAQSPTPYLIFLALLMVGAGFWGIRVMRRGNVVSSIRRSQTAYLYLLPAAAGMALLVFIPFAVGTSVAFFAHRGGEFSFVGLSHFSRILLNEDFPVTDPLSFYFTLGVTVLWTTANVMLHVTIGLALALALREPWLKMRAAYRVLFIIPWAIPNYITALIWKGMFNSQLGAVNGLLEMLGIEKVAWFSQFWTAFAANLTTNTWLGFPFMMVVCLGAMQAIPRELEEAAEMDGAAGWTRFRRVLLPLLRPALVPAVILGSVWTFNMFNIIYLVSAGEPDGETEILITEAYRWAFDRQEQYGYASAYAVLIFMALIGYSIFTKRLTQGEQAA